MEYDDLRYAKRTDQYQKLWSKQKKRNFDFLN
jgi:hypothetical protein